MPTRNGTLNNPCNPTCSTECETLYSSNCIIYNGENLSNIDIVTGDYLNEVLAALDTSVDPCAFTTLNTTVQYNNGAAPCGVFILKQNIVGSANNLMLGYGADTNVGGTNNTYLGINSGPSTGTSSGIKNVVVGEQALKVVTTGSRNTVNGYQSSKLLTTGSQNTCYGSLSGQSIVTGGNNTLLGYEADVARGSVNYGISLGAYSYSSDNALYIGGDDGAGDGNISDIIIGSWSKNSISGSSICTDISIGITGWETNVGNTDLNGPNLIFSSGQSTGVGLPGYFQFTSSETSKVSSDLSNGLGGSTFFTSTRYTTTDNTPVFIPVFFIGGSGNQITFNVVCLESATNKMMGTTFISTWKNFTVPTQVGTDDVLSNNSDAGLTVTAVSDDDGTNVGVTITGENAKTLIWHLTANIS